MEAARANVAAAGSDAVGGATSAENGTAAPRAEPSAPPPVATAAAAAAAPAAAANGKPGGSGQSDSSTAGGKRKRGRPRKYEDLTEEERKQRRAMDNRHAAKRSYYRRINKMAELEQANKTLKAELQAALQKLAAYEAGVAGAAGVPPAPPTRPIGAAGVTAPPTKGHANSLSPAGYKQESGTLTHSGGGGTSDVAALLQGPSGMIKSVSSQDLTAGMSMVSMTQQEPALPAETAASDGREAAAQRVSEEGAPNYLSPSAEPQKQADIQLRVEQAIKQKILMEQMQLRQQHAQMQQHHLVLLLQQQQLALQQQHAHQAHAAGQQQPQPGLSPLQQPQQPQQPAAMQPLLQN